MTPPHVPLTTHHPFPITYTHTCPLVRNKDLQVMTISNITEYRLCSILCSPSRLSWKEKKTIQLKTTKPEVLRFLTTLESEVRLINQMRQCLCNKALCDPEAKQMMYCHLLMVISYRLFNVLIRGRQRGGPRWSISSSHHQ